MADIIQWRRDGSNNWSTANPVMADGEVGYATDASMFKIGNGISSWNNLPYYSSGGGGGGNTLTMFANSNTTQSSSGTANISSLNFAGAGIASVGVTNGSVIISVPSGGGAGDGVNIVSMMTSTAGGGTGGATFSTISGSIGLMAGSNITLSQTSDSIKIYGLGQAFSADASSTFQTLTLQNSNGISFSNNAGAVRITHDLQYTSNTSNITSNALHTSASRVINIVAATNNAGGGTASLSSNVSFSAANGLTFYTSAGGAVVGSYSVPTVTNSSWSVSDNATSGTVGRLAFTNLNGVTLSLSTGTGGSHTIVGSHNGLTSQSNQTGNLYVTANSTQLSSTAGIDHRSLSFAGAGVASVGVSQGVVVISVPSGGGAGDGVNIVSMLTSTSGGSTAGATFSNSNVSIGLMAGSKILLSQTSNTIVIQADTSQDFWSIAGNTAGASNTYAWTNDGLYLAGGSNITLSQNGSTLTIVGAAGGGGNTDSYFANMDYMQGSTTLTMLQSTSHICPLDIRNDISVGFLRMLMSGTNLAASTTAVTSGNTSFTCGYTKSHNFVFYSRMNGASSDSLNSYFSTQITEAFANTISCATNSTQFSYSNRYTMPHMSGSIGFTKDYSSSAASINIHTSHETGLSGLKVVDFPMNTSFSAGQYWIMYGASSNTATQAAAYTVGLRGLVSFVNFGVSQPALAFGTFDSATNSSVMMNQGLGSFSTAGGSTVSRLGFSNISSTSAHNLPYYQMIRIT
jgi:hypothetical protein